MVVEEAVKDILHPDGGALLSSIGERVVFILCTRREIKVNMQVCLLKDCHPGA